MCLYIMRLYLRDAKEETFPYPDMLKLVRQSEQKISDYYREIEILDMQRPVPEQREEPVILSVLRDRIEGRRSVLCSVRQ